MKATKSRNPYFSHKINWKNQVSVISEKGTILLIHSLSLSTKF